MRKKDGAHCWRKPWGAPDKRGVFTSATTSRTKPYQFLYVTGDVHYDKVIKAVNDVGNPSNVIIRPFIHNMPEVLAGVDVIVARAGATTLAEITALGIPSILIPSPYVTNNHQEKMLERLKRKGQRSSV